MHMDTESYLDRMAALGIDRGALGGRFPDSEVPRTLGELPANLLTKRIGERVPAAAPEDLTHLNPKCSRRIAQQVRERWAKLDPAESSARNRRNGSGNAGRQRGAYVRR